jgi:hypothetical protein
MVQSDLQLNIVIPGLLDQNTLFSKCQFLLQVMGIHNNIKFSTWFNGD